MSVAILSSKSMAELESAAFAEGITTQSLIDTAVKRSTLLFQELYPKSKYSQIALLAGTGHNGCDALGIGCELLRENRSVIALLVGRDEQLKPATRQMCAQFIQLGGILRVCHTQSDLNECASNEMLSEAPVWIDGLFGYGLNRPASGVYADAIRLVNSFKKDIVALDIPSGLSCDLGFIDGSHICAVRTFALGAYKPAHVDDRCLESMGTLHWIDLHLLQLRHRINAPHWYSLDGQQLCEFIQSAKRKSASHKASNGRALIIAGSRRYPGAAVLACLGASVSGAGLIHALIPEDARAALLSLQPEIIFESRLPALEKFNSIVLGPGWVPGDARIFNHILSFAQTHPEVRVIFDAGCFHFVKEKIQQGLTLASNIVLTPHWGEFARIFSTISERVEGTEQGTRINRFEAASWAASLTSAHVILKGARTHIAAPDGTVASIIQSSPLLAHAGQGDVFAGLLGGLSAHMDNIKKAAHLAALLQSEGALRFSSTHPNALTLQPSELVRQLQSFQPFES